MLILSSKKMRQEPTNFILMLLNLTEAAFFLNFLMSYSACDLGMPKLLAITYIGHSEDSSYDLYLSAYTLGKASEFWNIFLWA